MLDVTSLVILRMPGIIELFRTRWPYAIIAVGSVPAYLYLTSSRFKLKNDWDREIVNQQYGVQDLSIERKAIMTNTNYTHAMGMLEVAELEKARHNTHQFTYLYTRQPVYPQPTPVEPTGDSVLDSPYSVLHQQKLDGRIGRARERAMQKKYKSTYTDTNHDFAGNILESDPLPK